MISQSIVDTVISVVGLLVGLLRCTSMIGVRRCMIVSSAIPNRTEISHYFYCCFRSRGYARQELISQSIAVTVVTVVLGLLVGLL